MLTLAPNCHDRDYYRCRSLCPLAELVDLNDEAARLDKEIKKFQAEVDRAKKKLSNERFVANALMMWSRRTSKTS